VPQRRPVLADTATEREHVEPVHRRGHGGNERSCQVRPHVERERGVVVAAEVRPA
jgi:hypothetical protein